jgi:hypothetical protein
MTNQVVSTDKVLNEAKALIEKARATLAEMPENIQPNTNTTIRRRQTMSTELTAQRAGELYAQGQTVIEVARAHGLTYGQTRKLIAASGTPIRDASGRLKGRTRKATA